ncbi:MAG TPA: M23 family metallopeptidase, partial [Thermoanaerobaculia bacterium]|nr:M23 family metallopeptidase [Thermoanaerobaculia bacterium]
QALRHRLTFRLTVASGKIEERYFEGVPVRVPAQTPLVLGPPLSGGLWVARAVGNDSYHRRASIAVRGHAASSQRLAIDWGRLDEQGHDHRGDGAKNEEYASYGSDVLAVADSVVVEARDGIAENDPLSTTPKVPITLETVAGNDVVLDLGGDRYALYAHLKPGSLRVRPGDHVRRGQVIALVGNSGNAYGPHLHFHVTDSREMIAGEGLPYEIDAFELLGHETEEHVKQGFWSPQPGQAPERRERELPADGAVVRFPVPPTG